MMIQHFFGVFYVTVVRLNQFGIMKPFEFRLLREVLFVRDNKSNIYFTSDRF
jgi:hypothetical protein